MTDTLYNYLTVLDFMEEKHDGVKKRNSSISIDQALVNKELNKTLEDLWNQSLEEDKVTMTTIYSHTLNNLIKENDVLITKANKTIIESYEKNPVFSDAMKGKISLSDSLEELSVVNKGIRKILPRRKNPVHNERINQLGELVDEPYSLKSNGILYPDNLVTNTVYFGGVAFALGYGIINYAMGHSIVVDVNTDNARAIYTVKTAGPFLLAGMLGPMFGVLSTGARFKSLDDTKKQAKYLDEKIKIHYKL